MRRLPPCRLCAVDSANAASVGGQGDRGGQAARHFQGETRPGQHAAGASPITSATTWCGSNPLPASRPFADPEKGHGGRDGLDLFQQGAQARQRRGENRQVGAPAPPEIGRDLQAGGKWAARQVAERFRAGRHVRRTAGIARPEAHRVPAGEGNGQRRTPGAGAEHGYPHRGHRRNG
jgi:hypothetical protein